MLYQDCAADIFYLLAYNLDPVYTRENGRFNVPKLVRIGLAFTRELLEPFQFGSAIRALFAPLQKRFHLEWFCLAPV